MPGDFDLTELLPFYLDETDEHIVALGDSLLRLEQNPADSASIQEIFRIAHSIKGSSTIMGFDGVKELTHNLETLFDQLRVGARTLDRPALDLCFRCLDELRDQHRRLRSGETAPNLLATLNQEVLKQLDVRSAPEESKGSIAPSSLSAEASSSAEAEVAPSPAGYASLAAGGVTRLDVEFEPDLPWPDMKAKLIVNRLSDRARIIDTEPPLDRMEEFEKLLHFGIRLIAECEPDELRNLADVDGVASVSIALETGERAVATASGSVAAAREIVPVEAAVAEVIETETEPAEEGKETERSVSKNGEPKPQAKASEAKIAKVAETLRIDVERLDHLMNLVGELVTNKARFAQLLSGLEESFRESRSRSAASDAGERLDALIRDHQKAGREGEADLPGRDRFGAQLRKLRDDVRTIARELDQIRSAREKVAALSEAVHQLGRITDGLQKGVLDTRMAPIGPLFERFRRVIRDLTISSGKEVALRISGEKTELDKRMIDELSDPLIHMVRNSVDHGLEAPLVRERVGKPRCGVVSLQAVHRGNSVIITVNDDGAGIDCDRLREKVVAHGLVSPEQAESMPENRLISYIFHPGLSTAQSVSEISGRGVGMDIVKSRIENLNGSVEVRTERGRGTTFTIRLPLTLAIMPSLLVRIEDAAFAIPLDHLDEIVEVKYDQLSTIRGKEVIRVRDQVVSLFALGDIFRDGARLGRSATGRAGSGAESLVVVLIRNNDVRLGLVVDRLIGIREMVLKSLKRNYRAVHGLSGASILGDGGIALILDVDALIEMASLRSEAEPAGRRSRLERLASIQELT